ncbi:MAG: DUF4783 domain-containing protein [Flavobacteriales bacterium]|nr:DUF4783 domain-containing protein [Flavobacteriales bacterium]
MKKNLLLSILFICASSFFVLAQKIDNEQIATALQTGNSSEIAKHFSSRVEISILGEAVNYSREAAEKKLFEFFDQNQPENYTQTEDDVEVKVDHVIGILSTVSGEYKVSYYLITTHEKHQINHLIIKAL